MYHLYYKYYINTNYIYIANTGDIKDTDLIPGSDDPLEENMTSHSNIYT